MFYESRGYMKCSLKTSTSRTMGVLRKCCIPPFLAILKQETPDKPMDSGDTLELSSLHWFTGKLKPETPIFHGKNHVFPLRCSLTPKPWPQTSRRAGGHGDPAERDAQQLAQGSLGDHWRTGKGDGKNQGLQYIYINI